MIFKGHFSCWIRKDKNFCDHYKHWLIKDAEIITELVTVLNKLVLKFTKRQCIRISKKLFREGEKINTGNFPISKL